MKWFPCRHDESARDNNAVSEDGCVSFMAMFRGYLPPSRTKGERAEEASGEPTGNPGNRPVEPIETSVKKTLRFREFPIAHDRGADPVICPQVVANPLIENG